jgi:hypothetical protein
MMVLIQEGISEISSSLKRAVNRKLMKSKTVALADWSTILKVKKKGESENGCIF